MYKQCIVLKGVVTLKISIYSIYYDSFILKGILLWTHSNVLAAFEMWVYLKKWCDIHLHQSRSRYQWSSGVQWKGRHWSVVLGSYGGVIAAIFLPYNNDLHDRPVTVDEVTGRGFKATVLMVKDNKYCYDKMRGEMTDGKSFFVCSAFQSHVCLLSKTQRRKTFFFQKGDWSSEMWLREEKERKSFSLSLKGLFHNH